MGLQRCALLGLDEGGVKLSNSGLRLVCLIEGGGKLVVWGSPIMRQNIDLVQNAGMPCLVECDCRPPELWGINYGHSHRVPQDHTLRVLQKAN